MFKHGSISTETDKGPFFFSLASFIFTGFFAFLFAGKGGALGILAGIILFIVCLASGATLFAMVTDRAYIEDGTLHMSYMFKKGAVKLEDIHKVSYKDEVYSVYDKRDNLVGTINGKPTGIGRIVTELDKRNIHFD